MEAEGAGAVLGGSSDGEYSQHDDAEDDSRSERSVSPGVGVQGKKARFEEIPRRTLDEEEDEEALALRLLTGGR